MLSFGAPTRILTPHTHTTVEMHIQDILHCMTQTYNAAVIQLTIPTRLVKSFMSHTWLDRSQVASQFTSESTCHQQFAVA